MFPELAAIDKRLKDRYPAADDRVAYLRTATDLQVTKASGLLAFTAIVCALATVMYDKVGASWWAQQVCVAAGLVALLASAFMLRAMWSSAPTAHQFATGANEADWLTELLVGRARLINRAVALSGLAAVLLVASLAMLLMPDSPYLSRPGKVASGSTP